MILGGLWGRSSERRRKAGGLVPKRAWLDDSWARVAQAAESVGSQREERFWRRNLDFKFGIRLVGGRGERGA